MEVWREEPVTQDGVHPATMSLMEERKQKQMSSGDKEGQAPDHQNAQNHS